MITSVFKRKLQHSPKPLAKHSVFDDSKGPTAKQKNKHVEEEYNRPPHRLPVGHVVFGHMLDRDKSPVSSISCPISQESQSTPNYHKEPSQNNTWINLWNEWGEISKEGTHLTKSATDSFVSSLSDGSASSSDSFSQDDEYYYGMVNDRTTPHFEAAVSSKHAPLPTSYSPPADCKREPSFIIPKEVFFAVKEYKKAASYLDGIIDSHQRSQPSVHLSSSFEFDEAGKTSTLRPNKYRPVFESPKGAMDFDQSQQEKQQRLANPASTIGNRPVLEIIPRKLLVGEQMNSFKRKDSSANRHQLDTSKRKESKVLESLELKKVSRNLFHREHNMDFNDGSLVDTGRTIIRPQAINLIITKGRGLNNSTGSVSKPTLDCRTESHFKDAKKHVRRRPSGQESVIEMQCHDEQRMRSTTQSNSQAENNLRHLPEKQGCLKNGGVFSLATALKKLMKKVPKLSHKIPNDVYIRRNMESCFDDAISSMSSKSNDIDNSLPVGDWETDITFVRSGTLKSQLAPQRHIEQSASKEIAVHRIHVSNPEELEVEYDLTLLKSRRIMNDEHARRGARRREQSDVSSNFLEANQMFVHDLEGDNLGFLETRSSLTSGKSSF